MSSSIAARVGYLSRPLASAARQTARIPRSLARERAQRTCAAASERCSPPAQKTSLAMSRAPWERCGAGGARRSRSERGPPFRAAWHRMGRHRETRPRVVDGWLRRSPPSSARLAFAIAHLDPHGEAVASFPPHSWLAAASVGFPKCRREFEFGARVSSRDRVPNSDGRRCTAHRPVVPRRLSSCGVASRRPSLRRLAMDQPRPAVAVLVPPVGPMRTSSLGLVDRFARPDWPLQEFLSAARDEDSLRQALEIARDKRSSLGLKEPLRSELARGALSVTPDQRRIIESRRW